MHPSTMREIFSPDLPRRTVRTNAAYERVHTQCVYAEAAPYGMVRFVSEDILDCW
jgi:hypothetical protein